MQKIVGYLIWLVALAGNGFIVFLWVVFGLAAAGGSSGSPEVRGFIWATALGVAIPFLLSAYFVSKERFGTGAALTLLMMPLVIGFTFAHGTLFKA